MSPASFERDQKRKSFASGGRIGIFPAGRIWDARVFVCIGYSRPGFLRIEPVRVFFLSLSLFLGRTNKDGHGAEGAGGARVAFPIGQWPVCKPCLAMQRVRDEHNSERWKKEEESLSKGRFQLVGIDRRLRNLIQFKCQSKWPVIELNESAALMECV
jgi:hypothetical protein